MMPLSCSSRIVSGGSSRAASACAARSRRRGTISRARVDRFSMGYAGEGSYGR